MSPSLPVDRPFTGAEAQDLGVGSDHLRRLVDCGEVRHLLHGVYVPGTWTDTPATRAQAAALVLPAHCVVSDRSAASLHGIDVLDYAELDVPPRLEVVSVGGTATRRPEVLGGKRDLLASEITTVGGVPVTTPLRTACDIGCLRGRHRAIGALDAFREKYGLTQGDLRAQLPRFRGRRGVIQLRELIPLAMAGRDSQPESWIGLDMHDAGFPMPSAQLQVLVPGWGWVRMENAYEHLRIAVEYDGLVHHSDHIDVLRDRDRREALRAAGWIVIVVRRDGLSGAGREAWLAELSRAYADRAPALIGRRQYSRGPGRRPRR